MGNKNILIISRSFRAGDAITTLNLFSKWPKENLFCASLGDSEYSKEVEEFYLLGNNEVNYKFPFNKILSSPPSRIGASKIVQVLPKKSFIRSFYRKFIFPILQQLNLYEKNTDIRVSLQFEEWINKIKPIAIHTSVGNIPMAKFILEIHKKFPNIKIIVHGFDDWINPIYKIIRPRPRKYEADKLLKEIIKNSSGRFTATGKMAKDYQERYGYNFITFTNPVSISNPPNNTKSITPNVVFTGKVAEHNDKALRQMISAIKTLNNQGLRVNFDIYTETSEVALQKFLGRLPSEVIIHKPVPNSEINNILSSAHALFLPITIDSKTVKFTRYSMSTKMGEYLWSGTPVIYYGPKGIAMTEFLESYQCATIITEPNLKLLIDSVYQSITNPNIAKINKGKEIAMEYFNKDKVSEKFTDTILSICNNKE